MSFGAVGQYEKLRGTAFGELDPLDQHNDVITDISLAPRNASGKVAYSMDIFILKPINLANGNHRVLLDMNNRGEMRLARLNEFSLDNPPLTNDPSTAADAGTGFVMSRGYTVVGNGWDVGATSGSVTGGGMTISLPTAYFPPGSASTDITGPSYEYLVNDSMSAAARMTFALTYPAATPDTAVLTARALLNDTPMVVPAGSWAYTDATRTAIRLLPAGTSFQRSWIYEFTYTAKNPVVTGIGLAATRDWISFLRHGTAAQGNPLAGDVLHTFSYSISQPSRTLNDFVHLGFNEGSQVGVVPQKELGWPDIPGVLYTGVITTRYFLDFGPDFDNGILSNYPPSVVGRPSYPIFVSKVDNDGNEIAGVRLPGVEAPIATTTGWALRAAATGGNDGCEANGQYIPFQRTKAERQAIGDPRKSLEERYKNHAGYVKEVAKAAQKLEKDGFLLADDVQRYIDEAEASTVLK